MTTVSPRAAYGLFGVLEDRAWTEFARCRGRLDLFFEPFGEKAPHRTERERRAKAMCAGCPVQGPCRESGRRNHELGIWGGETEEERIRAGYGIRSVTRSSLAAARPRESTADEQRSPASDHEVA